jgi:hypothetical protein
LLTARTTIDPSQAANACGLSSDDSRRSADTKQSCTRSSTSLSCGSSRCASPSAMRAWRRNSASCAHASPARAATTSAASVGPAPDLVGELLVTAIVPSACVDYPPDGSP